MARLRTRRRLTDEAAIAALVADVHPPPPAPTPVDVDARIAAALAERDRADAARAARAEAARYTSTVPCAMCGDVRLDPDRGFSPLAIGTAAYNVCPSCAWHFDRQFAHLDGRRDYAAAWLTGLEDQSAPPGLGARLGLRFHHELAPAVARDARSAFAWHTTADLVAWRATLGLDQPPPPPPPPPAPRLVGRMMVRPRIKPPVVTPTPVPGDIVERRRARW